MRIYWLDIHLKLYSTTVMSEAEIDEFEADAKLFGEEFVGANSSAKCTTYVHAVVVHQAALLRANGGSVRSFLCEGEFAFLQASGHLEWHTV